jgi:hypothetical protein
VQGFGWRGWVAASQFCVAQNTHLEQALEWAEIAVSKPFIGESNFTTLSNQAQVLEKLGRKEEAAGAMQTWRSATGPPRRWTCTSTAGACWRRRRTRKRWRFSG